MQYKYVLACNDGTSHDMARNKNYVTEASGQDHFDLADLLKSGWRPVREVPLGNAQWDFGGKKYDYAVVLILLEHE